MMRRTEQHSLHLKRYTRFAILQSFCRDVSRLISFVAHTHKVWQLGRGTIRPQVLCEAFLSKIDNGVCGRENRLCRSVIALQRGDLCARTKVIRKIENVANRGGPK